MAWVELPYCTANSFHMCRVELGPYIKRCFVPVLVVKADYIRLLVLFLPVSYATCVCLSGLIRQEQLSMASTTWVRSPLGFCLGDMAVRMQNRGLNVTACQLLLLFEKRYHVHVDCVKCVPILFIKTGSPTPYGQLKIARPTPYHGFKE